MPTFEDISHADADSRPGPRSGQVSGEIVSCSLGNLYLGSHHLPTSVVIGDLNLFTDFERFQIDRRRLKGLAIIEHDLVFIGVEGLDGAGLD